MYSFFFHFRCTVFLSSHLLFLCPIHFMLYCWRFIFVFSYIHMQIFNISVVQETLLQTRALPLPLLHSISIGKGYLHVWHTYIYRYFLHKNIQNHFKSRLSLSLSLSPSLLLHSCSDVGIDTSVYTCVCVCVCVRVPLCG